MTPARKPTRFTRFRSGAALALGALLAPFALSAYAARPAVATAAICEHTCKKQPDAPCVACLEQEYESDLGRLTRDYEQRMAELERHTQERGRAAEHAHRAAVRELEAARAHQERERHSTERDRRRAMELERKELNRARRDLERDFRTAVQNEERAAKYRARELERAITDEEALRDALQEVEAELERARVTLENDWVVQVEHFEDEVEAQDEAWEEFERELEERYEEESEAIEEALELHEHQFEEQMELWEHELEEQCEALEEQCEALAEQFEAAFEGHPEAWEAMSDALEAQDWGDWSEMDLGDGEWHVEVLFDGDDCAPSCEDSCSGCCGNCSSCCSDDDDDDDAQDGDDEEERSVVRLLRRALNEAGRSNVDLARWNENGALEHQIRAELELALHQAGQHQNNQDAANHALHYVLSSQTTAIESSGDGGGCEQRKRACEQQRSSGCGSDSQENNQDLLVFEVEADRDEIRVAFPNGAEGSASFTELAEMSPGTYIYQQHGDDVVMQPAKCSDKRSQLVVDVEGDGLFVVRDPSGSEGIIRLATLRDLNSGTYLLADNGEGIALRTFEQVHEDGRHAIVHARHGRVALIEPHEVPALATAIPQAAPLPRLGHASDAAALPHRGAHVSRRIHTTAPVNPVAPVAPVAPVTPVAQVATVASLPHLIADPAAPVAPLASFPGVTTPAASPSDGPSASAGRAPADVRAEDVEELSRLLRDMHEEVQELRLALRELRQEVRSLNEGVR